MPVKILIVDDQPHNLQALQAILAGPEYAVQTATTGEEALWHLLRDDFACVLLDVRLPGIDGFEVAALMRRRDRTRATPVIFLTATADDRMARVRGYALGAVDYLPKPSDPEVVRAKVGVFAELYRRNQRIREQAAALEAASKRRYFNLADAIPEIVFTTDERGRLRYLNRRFTEVTGRSADAGGDTPLASLLDVVHADDRERLAEAIAKAVTARGPLQAECRLREASGAYRWHLCRAVPERNGQVVTGWLGTCSDIHAQKTEEARAQAQVRARDEFLLVAAHELKTPLTALLLQIQRLRRAVERNDVPALAGGVDVAERSARRLERLVASLLDLSRLTVGRVAIERRALDLAQLVRDVVARLEGEARRTGSEVRLSAGAPVEGSWDRDRLDQVVTNLLSNAFKYGEGRPVEVTVERRGEQAVLIVRDHGIGIAEADQARIFRRFERAVSERNYGGLGIGLYVVGEIVRAHRGEIRVDSRPGAGATFTVTLPLGIE